MDFEGFFSDGAWAFEGKSIAYRRIARSCIYTK